MSRRPSTLCFVARVRSLLGAAGAIMVPAVLVVAGACAHDPPVAAPSAPIARRSVPARTPEPAVAAAEPAAPVASPPSIDAAPAIFFDFDSAVLRDEAHPELQRVADELRARRQAKLRVEGNCDQLGTIEYNLALGEHRAEAARQYLVQLGVPTGRIATVSYGSERPKYQGASEEARAKNRRDDLVIR